MAQRGYYLVLFLVLLVACLALARGELRYNKFKRQHIDFPRTRAQDVNTYCNQMMRRRGMASSHCKFTNTFIHAAAGDVTSICGSAGTPAKRNLRRSKRTFALTACFLQGRSQKPPCHYKGHTDIQRILVSCQPTLPIHYVRAM